MGLAVEFFKYLALVLGGLLALVAFYKSFEAEWPEHYFDGSRGVDPLISKTPIRYAIFRLVPVFVALVAVGAFSDRAGASRVIVVSLMITIYLVFGPFGKSILALCERPPSIGRFAHRFLTAVGIALTAGIYLGVGPHLDKFVPKNEDFVFSAWIAIFIFVLGRAGIFIATIPKPSTDELARRAFYEIEVELRDRLLRADPSGGFLAIAIVEQLNRPKWVRGLENLLLGRTGSYGLMQIHSKGKVTDDESVSLFILRNEKFRRELGDESALERLFRKQNSDESVIQFAFEIHASLKKLGHLQPQN